MTDDQLDDHAAGDDQVFRMYLQSGLTWREFRIRNRAWLVQRYSGTSSLPYVPFKPRRHPGNLITDTIPFLNYGRDHE